MRLEGFTSWTSIVLLLLASCTLVSSQLCNNGIIDAGEECDDGNTADNDGCSMLCAIENNYECNNTMAPSVCTPILLDLDVSDGSLSKDSTAEFFDLNVPVFLFDPTMAQYFISPAGDWLDLTVVILQADTTITEDVDAMISEAVAAGRITTSTVFSRDLLSTQFPTLPSRASVTQGTLIVSGVNNSGGALTIDEVHSALHSVAYVANEDPGFSPRNVCLIARDPMYSTTACVTLYFIGRNLRAPNITYTPVGRANFTEGQTSRVSIVLGRLVVEDLDHPTRYPIMSAEARIVGYSTGQPETLSLNPDYTLPAGMSHSFNPSTGVLTISGAATAAVYSATLEQIYYFNGMAEPLGRERNIEVTASDGVQSSDPATIVIDIVNTNDNPSVSLDGENPIIMNFTIPYSEGSGPATILPNLFVVDNDPSPIIIRATVNLINPLDGTDEKLDIVDSMGLASSITPHSLTLMGQASPAVYSAALRSVTYLHSDANPGNPTAGPRTVEIVVEDVELSSSQVSNLTINVLQFNDAPVLSYQSGSNQEILTYVEDDAAINIGQTILLTDVDSTIMSATLYLSNFLDGFSDNVAYNLSLLFSYGVTQRETSSGGDNTTRVVTIEGQATASQYMDILNSLTYQNLHTDNSVTDGQRNVTLLATDTTSLSSNGLTILINATERNDGPAIDLGAGIDTDFSTTFTENGRSVFLGLTHEFSVTDEEGHNVSSMSVELVSANGALDEGDIIFFRTPLSIPVEHITVSTKMITVNFEADISVYTNIIRAIQYVNTEPEPTLFVKGTTTNLSREVVIRITDAPSVSLPTTNEVRIRVIINPINDNAPRIVINSDPVCTEDIRDSGVVPLVNRRSTEGQMRSQPSTRRRRRKRSRLAPSSNAVAPSVLSIETNSSQSNSNTSCISVITIHFNTDTNAPVVEIQVELDRLLTFDPISLSHVAHWGYWVDYCTLVVVFGECVRVRGEEGDGGEEEGEGVGKDHVTNPVYVIFYETEDGCDWSTPCTSGVCFYNSTGCPVAGYYPAQQPANSSSTHSLSYSRSSGGVNVFLFILIALLVAFSTVVALEWVLRGKRSTAPNNAEDGLPIKHKVVSSHVIDIQIPQNTATYLPSSATNITKKTLPSREEIKSDALPPPYTIKAVPSSLTEEDTHLHGRGISNPPQAKHGSGVYASDENEEMVLLCNDVQRKAKQVNEKGENEEEEEEEEEEVGEEGGVEEEVKEAGEGGVEEAGKASKSSAVREDDKLSTHGGSESGCSSVEGCSVKSHQMTRKGGIAASHDHRSPNYRSHTREQSPLNHTQQHYSYYTQHTH